MPSFGLFETKTGNQLKPMLTRRKIETIQNWGMLVSNNYKWTKSDARLYLELKNLKKQISKQIYVTERQKKELQILHY